MFTKADDPFVERLVCFAAVVDLETRTIVGVSRSPCDDLPTTMRPTTADRLGRLP
jgi:hypothetical protein